MIVVPLCPGKGNGKGNSGWACPLSGERLIESVESFAGRDEASLRSKSFSDADLPEPYPYRREKIDCGMFSDRFVH